MSIYRYTFNKMREWCGKMNAYTITHMHACMHACMHSHIHTCIRTCVHPYIRTYSHRYGPMVHVTEMD